MKPYYRTRSFDPLNILQAARKIRQHAIINIAENNGCREPTFPNCSVYKKTIPQN
jgi:hypothetical protein